MSMRTETKRMQSRLLRMQYMNVSPENILLSKEHEMGPMAASKNKNTYQDSTAHHGSCCRHHIAHSTRKHNSYTPISGPGSISYRIALNHNIGNSWSGGHSQHPVYDNNGPGIRSKSEKRASRYSFEMLLHCGFNGL